MLQQGVQRFPAGLRLGLLLPEEAHSAGLPTSPSERCSTAASKVFLRAKKLWVNPPKAERAKPSLSSDYNLLFKNKIGERSLDIHRQEIEQVFDLGKNYASILPLSVQTEETFRGHMVLTFIATIVAKLLSDRLKETKYPIQPTPAN